MNNAKCELCGTPVKVVGDTTLHYEPIASVVSEEEIFRILRDKEIKEGGQNPDRYLQEQAHAIAEYINGGGK